MSYYYENPADRTILAITPRVASTSQRRLYGSAGYIKLTSEEAAAKSAAGATVHGVLRYPMARLISAYRRHAPGTVPVSFQEYVTTRALWDSHVMPQTLVHAVHGIKVNKWQTFEELIARPDFPHLNATPSINKSPVATGLGEQWIEWYRVVYKDDIDLYDLLDRT